MELVAGRDLGESQTSFLQTTYQCPEKQAGEQGSPCWNPDSDNVSKLEAKESCWRNGAKESNTGKDSEAVRDLD